MKHVSKHGIAALATVCLAGTAFGQVFNVSQGTNHPTIADAIANANGGDRIDLIAGTFMESGLVISGLDLTIRGQGPGLTIIDGSGGSARHFEIIGNGVNVRIEGVTLSNGTANNNNGGGAAAVRSNAVGTFSNVQFLNNSAGAFLSSTVDTAGGGVVILRECSFKGNSTAGMNPGPEIGLFGGEGHIIRNCLFEAGSGHQETIYIQAQGGPATATVINNTFVNSPAVANVQSAVLGAEVTAVANVYSTSVASPESIIDDGVIHSSRNVHPNLVSPNIGETPIFMDFVGGDFRLAESSPGIDAGDANAWFAAGGEFGDLGSSLRWVDVTPVLNTSDPFFIPIDCGAYETIPAVNSAPCSDCPADLTGASDPNDPSYGIPDGDADGDDFFYYLDRFTEGCAL